MSDIETMTIDLPSALADELRRSVTSGRFSSNSRAVEAAVRAWQDAHSLDDYSTEELRALVADGVASGPSPIASMDDLKREARRRWKSRPI